MRAVILAGGMGRRLRPLTRSVPKPLLSLGDSTILDVLLHGLVRAGVVRVTLAVGAHELKFREHLNRNGRYGIDIDCVPEDRPLGTIGPLTRVSDLPGEFLVVNGDLVTTLDFADLLAGHLESGAAVTIACQSCSFQPDVGVVQVDDSGCVVGYEEKPLWRYQSSLGVYAASSRVLSYLSDNQNMNFPDLVDRLLACNEKVNVYRFDGYWRDLGNIQDYRRAEEEFLEMRTDLVP